MTFYPCCYACNYYLDGGGLSFFGSTDLTTKLLFPSAGLMFLCYMAWLLLWMMLFSSLFSSDGLFWWGCYFSSTGFLYAGVLATFWKPPTSRGTFKSLSLLSSFLDLNGSLAFKSISDSFFMPKLSFFYCLAFSYCFCATSCFILFYSSFLYKADASIEGLFGGDLSSAAALRAGP